MEAGKFGRREGERRERDIRDRGRGKLGVGGVRGENEGRRERTPAFE